MQWGLGAMHCHGAENYGLHKCGTERDYPTGENHRNRPFGLRYQRDISVSVPIQSSLHVVESATGHAQSRRASSERELNASIETAKQGRRAEGQRGRTDHRVGNRPAAPDDIAGRDFRFW